MGVKIAGLLLVLGVAAVVQGQSALQMTGCCFDPAL